MLHQVMKLTLKINLIMIDLTGRKRELKSKFVSEDIYLGQCKRESKFDLGENLVKCYVHKENELKEW